SFRILLAYWKQLNVIHVFEKVFDFIVIIGFISIYDRSIGKLIGVILEGIHIPKTTMSQKTLDRLAILSHHQMDFQTIKISLLARLIAPKLFIGMYLGPSNTNIITDSDG